MRLARGVTLLLLWVSLGWPSGAALAGPPSPRADDLHFTYTGTLAEADPDAVRLTLADGTQLSFKPTEQTRVAWPGVRGATLAGLEGGLQVRVTVERPTPQAAWTVTRVRVLDRPSASTAGGGAGSPALTSLSGVTQTYTEDTAVAVTQATGGATRYMLTAETRLLPAGHAAPAAGDRVLLLFRRDRPSAVWAIVVLPPRPTTPDWIQ